MTASSVNAPWLTPNATRKAAPVRCFRGSQPIGMSTGDAYAFEANAAVAEMFETIRKALALCIEVMQAI